MAIDLRTLRCNQCGSTSLQQVGPIHFQCTHCRSTTLVDHRPAVPPPTAVRPAAPVQRASAPHRVLLGVTLALVLVGGLLGFAMALRAHSTGPTGRSASVWSRGTAAAVDPTTIRAEARSVVSGQGSSAEAKVLVTVHNAGATPVGDVELKVAFFDGAKAAGTAAARVSGFDLMPGEKHVLLVDPPKTGSDRQTVTVQQADPLEDAVSGPVLKCARARLVQRGPRLRFVCSPHNDQSKALTSVRAFVTAYDAARAVVGFGEWAAEGAVSSGSDGLVAGDLTMVSARPVATWDYRLHYELAGQRGAVTSPDRTTAKAEAPETWPEKLPLDDAALAAPNAAAFDPASLRVAAWQLGHDNTQNSVLLSEVSNSSKDTVAVALGGLVTPYDGKKAGQPSEVSALYLYPGEALPMRVVPRGIERFTRADVTWAPARRAALPGARVPLEVTVGTTHATTGSVLVNFSQRFTYKAVEVKGSIKNLGTKVAKPRVWVMLRDKSDRLAGFERVEAAAVAPGESVAFAARVVEEGSAWARVTTTYQTE